MEQDEAALAHAYNNLGNIFAEDQACDQILEFYGKALKLLEQSQNVKILSQVYKNPVIVYKDLN